MASTRRVLKQGHRLATPAFITGTSSEYLGKRPLPRVLRGRRAVFVLGPSGVGKSSVARRIAGPRALTLDTREVQNALVEQVALGGWSAELLDAPELILDGPVWLRHRPAAVEALRDLLKTRARGGHRTLVCQLDSDGSIHEVVAEMEPGSVVVMGLRYPKGPRGRLRFARRMCDAIDLPRTAARGTDIIDPWGYDAVVEMLAERRRSGEYASSEGK